MFLTFRSSLVHGQQLAAETNKHQQAEQRLLRSLQLRVEGVLEGVSRRRDEVQLLLHGPLKARHLRGLTPLILEVSSKEISPTNLHTGGITMY